MAWNTPGSDNSGGSNGRTPRRRPQRPRPRRLARPLARPVRRRRRRRRQHRCAGSRIVLGLWLVFNCFVLVTEQQRGVVLRFGQFARVLQPGPHFKAPWPIERVTKVNATQINDLQRHRAGAHPRREHRATSRSTCSTASAIRSMYLFGTRDADQRAQAGRAERRARAGRPLRPGHRAQRAHRARPSPCAQRLQASLRGLPHRPGRDRAQPAQRAPAGRGEGRVRRRRQRAAGQDTAINEAQAYAKQGRAGSARRGRAHPHRRRGLQDRDRSPAPTATPTRFSLLVDQYKAAPEVTRKRLWLETVQEVLADNRKIIGGDCAPADLRADGRQARRAAAARAAAADAATCWRRPSTSRARRRGRARRTPRADRPRGGRHDEILPVDRRRRRRAARAARFGVRRQRRPDRDRAQPRPRRAHRHRPGPALQGPLVETARVFDRRLQVLDAEPERYLTSEKQGRQRRLLRDGPHRGRARVLPRHRRRRGRSPIAAPGADHHATRCATRSTRARCSRWCPATAPT